jgi:hypothetical protein
MEVPVIVMNCMTPPNMLLAMLLSQLIVID